MPILEKVERETRERFREKLERDQRDTIEIVETLGRNQQETRAMAYGLSQTNKRARESQRELERARESQRELERASESQ